MNDQAVNTKQNKQSQWTTKSFQFFFNTPLHVSTFPTENTAQYHI